MDKKRREKALLLVARRSAVARASDEQLQKGGPRLIGERLVQTRLDTTQIRNLENLAYTTDKISDITDLLKKLIGRDTHSQRWGQGGIGVQLIAALEALREEANRIGADLRKAYPQAWDDDLSRRIHLDLCREYVKHLASEFLYQKWEKEGQNAGS